MKNFITTADVQALNYIPREKLQTLVDDLNRILKVKVAGNSDADWNDFLAEYNVQGAVKGQAPTGPTDYVNQ